MNDTGATVTPTRARQRDGAFTGPAGHADVTVIVVTYNSAADLEPLLAALRPETAEQRVRVVIADNASADDTLAVARAHDDVIVLATGGNLGYAGAINVAMGAIGDTDAVFILNPDARVQPGALATMRRRQSRSGAAVVAPLIVGSDGTRYPSLRREPTVRRSLGDALLGRALRNRPAWLTETVHQPDEYDHAHPIDWASGAALLISADAARAVGPWDEQFFLYSEETDFQRRVRDAGMRIWYEPAARVQHAERGSGFSLALDRLIAVNRVRYARTHMGRARAAAYRGTVALHHLVRSRGASYRAIFRTVVAQSTWSTLPRAQRDAPAAELSAAHGAIIIPAHDEGAVLARTLAGLAPFAESPGVEVVVVPNGCTDDTVAVARSCGFAHVVESAEASKAAALNLGDRTASEWPRLYLDADIEVTPAAVLDTLQALGTSPTLAARPRYEWDLAGTTAVVRAYYRARGRLAMAHASLWGAGVYGVSRSGHGRFAAFPRAVADDVFVDRLFAPEEKAIVETEPVIVRVPKTTRALLSVLGRQARGAREQSSHTAGHTLGQLLASVRGPVSLSDALVYGTLSLAARRTRRAGTWERDETSRAAPAAAATLLKADA